MKDPKDIAAGVVSGNIPTGPTRTREELVAGVKAGTIDPLGLKAEEFQMLQQDEAFQTPLMIQYNKLVGDDDRLNVTIMASMQRLATKGMDPSWQSYEGTLNWTTWAMNLTEVNKKKVEERWKFLYTELVKGMSEAPVAEPSVSETSSTDKP